VKYEFDFRKKDQDQGQFFEFLKFFPGSSGDSLGYRQNGGGYRSGLLVFSAV
jgi:hypothetical protein